MYGVSPFILMLIGLFFQLIYGRKAINQTISLSFGAISIISITLQAILSIIAYFVAAHNFFENLGGNQYHCGMGMLGIIMISFFIFLMLLMVIIVQHLTRKNYQ
ncbi:hypothetical protein [Flavobacterium foetidum]|uniref:hypothetical protein n=1 Tax=Flavobacterium foetidum TaxID=2026681 RepID=UPI0010755179|nr:hypothetical protein [Flavobacterium foetidum]KAF2517931.1 hypothetical protein E0W73_01595 [Flavobacterium foetidum]